MYFPKFIGMNVKESILTILLWVLRATFVVACAASGMVLIMLFFGGEQARIDMTERFIGACMVAATILIVVLALINIICDD